MAKKRTKGKGRKAPLSERRRARKAYEKARKTSKPGEGKRFKALVQAAKASGAKNPEAVAAKIMWKKYGKKGGKRLIRMGKRRKNK